MPIPDRKRLPIQFPDLEIQITDDGSRTLVRLSDGVAYHSGCGAWNETRHVYLGNSGVPEKFLRKEPCCVLEIGLGTGMAMLATLDEAISAECKLEYVAIENLSLIHI